ncbi:YhcH/YjgK/YiaL family protein [[Clostridium] symbiosum]|uniref:YhcH/YjgK/YiaL family protein n=1 Tax=Clostridium symbiosum TaxID=1512 RepID=UPI001D0727E6|nr:YhcH/YjgK/YiaL family protein [[Clostridium] symbiosum]MCB6607778.1 YhcH/YjgK/YiaL family protein [[Clostridium] symbiosum]MCB6932639.1 YhcH/YjgK/YiaL family protein [[Clostridium] symbiosum]
MIIDKLEHASRYYSISPDLEYALRYLEEHREELAQQPLGVSKLTDRLQIKYLSYNTVEGSRKWESHLEFTDLQYMIRGAERIGFNQAQCMVNPSKQEGKDQILYDGDGDRIRVPEGYFIILFPGEVHMSKLADKETAPVQKASLKIRL